MTRCVRIVAAACLRVAASASYADGEVLADVLAVVEPVPDETGADDVGVLAEVAVGVDVVAVGDVVGVEVGEVVGDDDGEGDGEPETMMPSPSPK